MLSEGLSEACPPCATLPAELAPKTPFRRNRFVKVCRRRVHFTCMTCGVAIGERQQSIRICTAFFLKCLDMFYQLQRHPVAVRAWFRHSLVLTYAFPEDLLRPLLPPGLELDTYHGLGFVAIAIVQTEGLRPEFFPAWLGQDFFLAGYRIFARYRTNGERTLRGLRILRSDTNRRLMLLAGNFLTHYQYRFARVIWRETPGQMEIKVHTPRGEADLDFTVLVTDAPAALPVGSLFPDQRQARLFAGPLPFTFDYEPQTHSIILIEGERESWHPKPVEAAVRKVAFFEQEPFAGTRPVLANAFLVSQIPYRWKRGVREPLPRNNAMESALKP